jgi:hypothetical protein
MPCNLQIMAEGHKKTFTTGHIVATMSLFCYLN